MNAKRILSLFLAAVLTLGVAVTPAVAASAAPALPGSAALEESNGPVSIKLTASGPLVYGSPFELVVETRPAETQYLGVVLGTKGEALLAHALPLADECYAEIVKLIEG